MKSSTVSLHRRESDEFIAFLQSHAAARHTSDKLRAERLSEARASRGQAAAADLTACTRVFRFRVGNRENTSDLTRHL